MNDHAFLKRAADLAAAWMTFPNPRVGCVIVRNGVIVGEGAHQRDGDAHAEINALALAGDLAQGATAFVTLEPCKHVGRTGACAEALIAAGIARVVIGVPDPTSEAGGGADVLRAAGIDVEFVASEESRIVNEHWLHVQQHGRPFVTLKLATSSDGRVAAADGVETAISNDSSRKRVHALRARVDAVLVGTNTAVVDDPELTVRFAQTAQQARRFIMGLRQLPANLRALQGSEPAVQLHTHDPQQAMALLADQRIRHVLVEGGPTIARAFIEAGLVDEVIWITAPVVLVSGPLALGEMPLSSLHRWRRVATEDLDGDLWSVLRP